MKKQVLHIIPGLVSILLFTGCGNTENGTMADTSAAAAKETSAGTLSVSDRESDAIALMSVTKTDLSELFSDRDYDIGVEEADAVKVMLSDAGSSADGDGVLVDGDTITVTEEGTYVLTGTLSCGQVIVDAADAKVQLVLGGVSVTSEDSAAIYVKNADKVFLTLEEGTENAVSNEKGFDENEEDKVDAAIFSDSDLTINGSGALSVTSPAGHGIASKDELSITGGTIEITAENAGMKCNDELAVADGNVTINTVSGKGIKSDTLIAVLGGSFTIATGADDGLHSDGAVMIAGGDFVIRAGDDGIHADGVLSVSGGTIDIEESNEGLEGLGIELAGGHISIIAKDDGLNATNGADGDEFGFGFGGMEEEQDADGEDTSGDFSTYTSYVAISGGTLTVDAGGDGLDSNGTLTVSGGETVVYGPTNNGNGALDYGTEAVITGGSLVAFGSSGMAVNFGNDSEQGSILLTFDTQEAGSSVTLKDADGAVVYEGSSKKAFGSVLISVPEIADGKTYRVTAGTSEMEITMDGRIYGGGNGMMGPGMPDGGMMPENGGMMQNPPQEGRMPQEGPQEGQINGDRKGPGMQKGRMPEKLQTTEEAGETPEEE